MGGRRRNPELSRSASNLTGMRRFRHPERGQEEVPARPAASTISTTDWDRYQRRIETYLKTTTTKVVDKHGEAVFPKFVEPTMWGAVVWDRYATPVGIVVTGAGRRPRLAAVAAEELWPERIIVGQGALGSAGFPVNVRGAMATVVLGPLSAVLVHEWAAAANLAWLYAVPAAVGAGAYVGGSRVLRWVNHRGNKWRVYTSGDLPKIVTGLYALTHALQNDDTHADLSTIRGLLWTHATPPGEEPGQSPTVSAEITQMCAARDLPVPGAVHDLTQGPTPNPARDALQATGAASGQPREADPEGVRLARIWRAALGRHNQVRDEWWEHQHDIEKVLSLPTLSDVTEPATAEFITRLGHANDLATDLQPTGAEQVERYAAATRAAQVAWQQARTEAHRTLQSRFAPDERTRISRVKLLMAQATSGGTTAAERQTYYRQATRLLDTLQHPIVLPAATVEAIEAKVRGELPAAGHGPER